MTKSKRRMTRSQNPEPRNGNLAVLQVEGAVHLAAIADVVAAALSLALMVVISTERAGVAVFRVAQRTLCHHQRF